MNDVGSISTTVNICDKTHVNITLNIHRCGVTEVLPKGFMTIEKSDSYYLFYVNSGMGNLDYKTTKTVIQGEQGFFVTTDEACTLSNNSNEPLHIVWVAFTGNDVGKYLKRAGLYEKRPVFADDDGTINQHINFLYEVSNTYPNRYCKMASALYSIFAILLDKYVEKSVLNHSIVFNTSIKQALDYIETNYVNNISVDEIAEILGVSRNHLHNIFLKSVGMSPKKYLIYFRLDKACRLLESYDGNISEIAEMVGYSNQFYFAREFKRFIGITPTQFKRNPIKNELFSYNMFLAATNKE